MLPKNSMEKQKIWAAAMFWWLLKGDKAFTGHLTVLGMINTTFLKLY